MRSAWDVELDGQDFLLRDPAGDVQIRVTTPIELVDEFTESSHSLHTFIVKELKESSIHDVYTDGLHEIGDRRIGLLIPANALGSRDHDEADKKYFRRAAHLAIKMALRQLATAESQMLASLAGAVESIGFSDLYPDETCFLLLDCDGTQDDPALALEQIIPSLIARGYVPAGLIDIREMHWFGEPPKERRLKVHPIAAGIDDAKLISKVITLSVVSGASLITQFFYLYQVFEYLMDSVMRHRLPAALEEMVEGLEEGILSPHDQYRELGKEISEEGRLRLLSTAYSSCSVELEELSNASSEFLEKQNYGPVGGIKAVYKVRNFLFHRARDLAAHDDPYLKRVVDEMYQFVPFLLNTFKIPDVKRPDTSSAESL